MERRIWHRFYDEGVPYEIPLPQETLVALMGRAVGDFPDLVATEFFGARLTYRQFADQVNRFAASLSGLGVKAGDRVAIMLPNCPQTIIAFYATLTLGAVAVMTNPMYVEREMEHQFRDAGVKVLVKVYVPVPVRVGVPVGVRVKVPVAVRVGVKVKVLVVMVQG